VAEAVHDRTVRLAERVVRLITDELHQLLPSYPDPSQRLTMLRALVTATDGPSRVAAFLRSLITDTEIDFVAPLLAAVAHDLGDSLDEVLEGLFEFGRPSPSHAERSMRAANAAVSAGELRAARYFAERWEDLWPSVGRSSLRKALVDLLDAEPDYAEEIASIVGPINLRSSDRDSFVRAFLRVARSAERSEVRAAALSAAMALAAPSKPARKLVSKTQSEMIRSSDPRDVEAARRASRA
jgi:hypothetical protein